MVVAPTSFFCNAWSFVQRWFFSTNHKDIGTLYSFFGAAFGIIVMVLCFAMRVAHCDGTESASVSVNALTVLVHATGKILILFIIFGLSLAMARRIFRSSFIDELTGYTISLYFFGFMFYRVYNGLSLSPLVFFCIAFGYFLWASFKNLKSFLKLAESPQDLIAFRNDLYDSQYDFNLNLAKYFLVISAPLLTNLIYILVNIYLNGLISGFNITPTAVVYCLNQLQNMAILSLAIFSSLAYYMLSLCWSKHLLDLRYSVFYKLTFCLFIMPLVILSLIFFCPFLNMLLTQLFLTFFLIYFLVMFELILLKRIKLCETTHIEKTVFFFKKLMGVYNIGVFVLGAYTFYGALVVAEFLPFLASLIPEDGSIFLSPSMFYDNAYFLGEKSLHFVANLLTIFQTWFVFFILFFCLLSGFLFAFFVSFNYAYKLDDELPFIVFYFRLWCVSSSIFFLFLMDDGVAAVNPSPDNLCLLLLCVRLKRAPILASPRLCGILPWPGGLWLLRGLFQSMGVKRYWLALEAWEFMACADFLITGWRLSSPKLSAIMRIYVTRSMQTTY